MQQTVKKTFDYDIFKKHENNRPLDPNNVKRLTYSISTQNMLEFRPILVDSKMRVIDGQHRLEVAKNMGLEIYYQMNEESTPEDIVLLNNYQRHWRNEDYITHWASLGNENYKKLINYAKKRGMHISQLYTLLRGNFGIRSVQLKNGTYKFFDPALEKEADQLIDKSERIIAKVRQYTIEFPQIANSYRMQQAVFALLQNPQVDMETLIAKITYKADSLRPCTKMTAYYTMLRDIYNWKNTSPIE